MSCFFLYVFLISNPFIILSYWTEMYRIMIQSWLKLWHITSNIYAKFLVNNTSISGITSIGYFFTGTHWNYWLLVISDIQGIIPHIEFSHYRRSVLEKSFSFIDLRHCNTFSTFDYFYHYQLRVLKEIDTTYIFWEISTSVESLLLFFKWIGVIA